MKPKILVIGGSGLIGSKVVEKLKQKGNDAVAAPPGEGSDKALAGVEVVVDVANSPFFQDQAAWEFFQIVGENLATAEVADAINFLYTAYENLAAAEVAAGVKHHIALSVMGTERLQDSAYFRAKLIQETLIKGSAIPYTIIRATQVFEFIRAIAHFGTEGDTVRVAHSLFQPVAAEDIASAIGEAALGEPRNGTIEIAGPDVFVVTNDPRGLYYGVKVNDRSLMPRSNPRLGSTRFDWWLTQNPSPQTS
jgi:uncharacterized protein YbjT (DUF2867 family)